MITEIKHLRIYEKSIQYRISGEGSPTLLVHGSGVNHTFWSKLVNDLPERKLYLPDMIGHGGTPPWSSFGIDRHYEIEDDVKLLEGIVKQEGVPVDIVAHSSGATFAIAYTTRFPETVRKLVAIEPILPTILEDEDKKEWENVLKAYEEVDRCITAGDFEGAARAGFEYNLGTSGWANLPEMAKQKITSMAKESISTQSYASLRYHLKPHDFDVLNMPVLVLRGTETRRGIQRMSEVFAERVGSARFESIDGAAHMLPTTHPREVNRWVVDFLISD